MELKTNDAIKEKETTKMYNEKVAEKASNLKKMLGDDVKLKDEQYMEIMQDVWKVEYKVSMKSCWKKQRTKWKTVKVHSWQHMGQHWKEKLK